MTRSSKSAGRKVQEIQGQQGVVVQYGTKTLEQETLMLDYNSPWNDWLGYKSITVPRGTKVNIRVEKHPDGRTYFTAFTDIMGRFYSNTKYRETPSSKVEENVASGICHQRVCERYKPHYEEKKR